ncbi:MAG TPA: MarR family transcriptional regulator [Chloroflexota bacterium]|nr:MarR family transcriptional regulator [Chloroflexota bacterium]
MSWTDRLFGSPTRVALLRVLAAQGGHPVSVRELARLAGMSPIQASRLVREFARLGVVSRAGPSTGGGRGAGPAVRADLGHAVMRELVLPLLAFEERELERVAASLAETLAERHVPCRAVVSTVGGDGTHRLIVVVPADQDGPGGADPRRVTAALRDRAPASVLSPVVEVRRPSELRDLSPGALRRRWGATISQLFEEGEAMGSLPSTLRHDFAAGLDGWTLYDPLAQRVRWLGREALLLGGGGGVVLAPVGAEPPYTLRATVSGGAGECYVGCCFHLADSDNFESIYLAPQAGSHPAAVQYDPVIRGSHTWQIFGDADGLGDPAGLARAPLRQERWHRLRVDVWPDLAQVYVDDESTPLGTFPLRSGRRRGRVGLWGYLPGYVADFEVSPLVGPVPSWPGPRVTPPPGLVRDWLVARLAPDDGGSGAPGAPADLQAAVAEHNGVLCLNRCFRFAPGARAGAACEIEVPAGAREVALELGYSDRARIWWDGALVHEGEWRWDGVAGTDGRVRPGQRVVALETRPGWHALLAQVAVVEPPFGWGLAARVTADGAPCRSRPASQLDLPPDR